MGSWGDGVIGRTREDGVLPPHHRERSEQSPHHPSWIAIIAPNRPVCAPWPRWENQWSPSHFVQMALVSTLAARTPARFKSSQLAAVSENQWRSPSDFRASSASVPAISRQAQATSSPTL